MRKLYLYSLIISALLHSNISIGQLKVINKKILFYAITDDLKNSFISKLKGYTFYKKDTLVTFSVFDIKGVRNKTNIEEYLNNTITTFNNGINFSNKDNDTSQLNYLLNFDYIITLQANKPLDKIIEFNIDIYRTNKTTIDENFPFLDRSFNISKTILLSENDLTSDVLENKIISCYRFFFNPENSKPDFTIKSEKLSLIKGDTIFVKRFDTLTLFTSFINENPINYSNYSTQFVIFNDANADNFFINNEVKIIGSTINKITMFFNKSGIFKLKQLIYNSITNETFTKFYILEVKEGTTFVKDIILIRSLENGVINKFLSKEKRNLLISTYFNFLPSDSKLSMTSEGKSYESHFFRIYDSSSSVRINIHDKKTDNRKCNYELKYSNDTALLSICSYHSNIKFTIPSNQYYDENILIKNTILYDNLYSSQKIFLHKYNGIGYLIPSVVFINYQLGNEINSGTYSLLSNAPIMILKYGIGINLLRRFSLDLTPSLTFRPFQTVDTVQYNFSRINYSIGLTYREDLASLFLNNMKRNKIIYKSSFLSLSIGYQNLNITENLPDSNRNLSQLSLPNRLKKSDISHIFWTISYEIPILYKTLKRLVFFNLGVRASWSKTKYISVLNKKLVLTQDSNPQLTFGFRIPVF